MAHDMKSTFVRFRRWLAVALLLSISPASFAQVAETVTYYYTDQQGTPLVTADAAGNILTTSDYRPYGSEVLGSPQAGPGYTGHVDDPDSGLVYMQARYYDPVIGRFLGTDPVTLQTGDTFGFNRFAYVNDNPVGNVDPNGQESACVMAASHCSGSSQQAPAGLGDAVKGVVQGINNQLMKLDAGVQSGTQESPDYVPTNAAEASGVIVGTIIGQGVEAAATDGESLELSPMARGRASEAAILMEEGLEKNNTKVYTSEGAAIPDSITDDAVYEIKDTARVTATRQVRIESGAAREQGKKAVLITGKNTKISRNARGLFDRIETRKNLGPQG